MAFKYRDHRGSFADAMLTMQLFESKDDLVTYLQSLVDKFGVGVYDCTQITIKPYIKEPDIGWDTHIVSLEGYGVFGFTDRPVQEEAHGDS